MINWDAIGAISEALGAIAVLATLIYLARQVRHARTEVARNVNHSRVTAARDMNLAIALDERIGTITQKANTNLGGVESALTNRLVEEAGLTPEEAKTFAQMQVVRWQFQTQVIDDLEEMLPGHRTEFENFVRYVYGDSEPATRLWYETTKPFLNPTAVGHIDRILKDRT